MTTIAPSPAQQRMREAMKFVRKYQHFPECPCNQHRDAQGEGFCSYGHATWNRAIDALLDELVKR